MGMQNRTRIALFLLFGLTLATWSAKADEWSHHWSVGSNPELYVTAGDASVVVEQGSGSEIDATLITRGWSIGGTGVQVSEYQTGNRVEIKIKVPSVHFSFGNRSIRLEVRVPRDLTADLHTGDGSIQLRGLHGNLHADTGDGSIQGNDLDGNLDVHTGDGSLHVSGRFDGLQLRTQDGSVDLDVQRGSKVGSDWRVQTGDGSVHITLPHELAADLELHTGDGSIHSDLPLSVMGSQGEHDIRGKLNGGGSLLTVRTGDGSITIGAA